MSDVEQIDKIFSPAMTKAFKFSKNNAPREGNTGRDALKGKIPLSQASLDCMLHTLWEKTNVID